MFGSLAPSRLWPASLLGLALACASLASFAGEPGVEGVIVLRNGNVLVGVVRQSGDYYRIESAGAVLQVPAAQVDTHCRTLDEAYEIRRRDRTGLTADSHVELARWCLRQNLLDQAARELLDARTLDAGHPALASLQMQLEQIIQIKTLPPAAPGAAAETSVALPGRSKPLPEAPPLEIPAEARTQFVRSIQPMLIHTCASGGCHQTGSSRQLQFNRWALDGNGNPAFVRRNLAAVIEQIRQDDPASSPLLRYARQEHGGAPGALSKPLEPFQLTMLVEWINNATGFVPPEPVAPSQEANAGATGELVAVQERAPESTSGGAPPPLPAALTPAVVAAAPRQAAPFVPRDAFDPDIFNRRVAARETVTGSAAPSAEPANTPASE